MPRLSNAALWDRLQALGKAVGPRPAEPKRHKRRQEESKMQRALVRWFDLNAKAKWGLNPLVLFSIPNGGLRGVITAAIMKAEGQRAGVPDLMLAAAGRKTRTFSTSNFYKAGEGINEVRSWVSAPDGCFYGLFLELKTPEGRISPEQEIYHEVLRGRGYRVEVIRSFDEGVEVITKYLS